jgi:two-component system phosphate regulon response regulator PhoB
MSHLLLIEDDSSLGATLKERLEREGYKVDWTETLEAGRAKLLVKSFDLVILDVNLPDGSGFELGRALKKETTAPFIFVSAMTSAPHRLEGYEIGAEEYIPKPFHLKELLLRVKHVLLNHVREKNIKCGSVVIDFEKRAIVSKSGELEFLPVKDFNLLKLLIDISPRVLSRDEILDKVWGDEKYPSPRTVDNMIVRLRSLLHDSENLFIRSVRGVGYQWLGDK